MIIFTVNIKVNGADPSNSQKEDLQVFLEGPDADKVRILVMGGSKGAFHIGLTPEKEGSYVIPRNRLA